MTKTRSLGVIFETASFGGPHRYITNILDDLGDNFNVTVIIPKSHDRFFYNKLRKCNIKIIEVPLSCLGGGIINSLFYLIFMFFNVLRLRKFLGSIHFDILYIMGGSSCFLSVLLGFSCSGKICWNINDSYMPPIVRPFFWLFSRFVKNYVLTNQRTYEFYKNLIPNDSCCRIIESAVCEEGVSRNCRPNFKSDIVNLVAVGNISPVKGYEDLIDILVLLKARCSIKFNLTIVGKVFSRQRDYYYKISDYAISKGVSVEILTDVNEVSDILCDQDIFVMTSRSESSPLALYEALLVGMPFVVFEFTDLTKLEGLDGFVVKERDKSLFSGKIVALCKDKLGYSVNNQLYVKRFHSPVVIATAHRNFFERLQ